MSLVSSKKTQNNIVKEKIKRKIFDKQALVKSLKKHWQLYLFLIPPVLYLIIFKYVPMYGVQIAFREYNPAQGILGSKWVGLKQFIIFFKSNQFGRLLTNTVGISIYSIVVNFPVPIILAIALNECKAKRFSKTVQLITYAPYFISTVILVGILNQFISPVGLLNNLLTSLGMQPVDLLAKPGLFKSIYVWSGVWQGTGYSAVVYLAALSGISSELEEAARIDGCSTLQKIWNIDIPGIMPTAIILLILSSASILNVGYEKIYLMQNQLNMSTSDVISTYVFRIGIGNAQYSYSAAIGLFNSAVSLFLFTIVNKISKKVSDTSLW